MQYQILATATWWRAKALDHDRGHERTLLDRNGESVRFGSIQEAETVLGYLEQFNQNSGYRLSVLPVDEISPAEG